MNELHESQLKQRVKSRAPLCISAVEHKFMLLLTAKEELKLFTLNSHILFVFVLVRIEGNIVASRSSDTRN